MPNFHKQYPSLFKPIAPASLEGGTLQHVKITQMGAGSGDDESAESSLDSTEVFETEMKKAMEDREEEEKKAYDAIGCLCVSCTCVACLLVTLATAFFASGGVLHGKENEESRDVGTGLLIAGGVVAGLCVSKCWASYSCIK
jgi:hypothetical protein